VLQYLKAPEAFDAVYAKVSEAIVAEKNALVVPEFNVQIKENDTQAEFE